MVPMRQPKTIMMRPMIQWGRKLVFMTSFRDIPDTARPAGGGDDRSHREAGVGADAERDGDAGGRDAIVAADLDQHGQDAVVQRVRRDGQTDEAAQEGEDEMQMLGQCGGQDVDDELCHGDDHAGVVQDADHDTGGQNGGDQRDGFGSVCGETGFLLFGVREVDDEGEHAAQHEDEVVGKLSGEEEHEDDDSQQDVVPEQLGAKELCGGFVHDFGSLLPAWRRRRSYRHRA